MSATMREWWKQARGWHRASMGAPLAILSCPSYCLHQHVPTPNQQRETAEEETETNSETERQTERRQRREASKEGAGWQGIKLSCNSLSLSKQIYFNLPKDHHEVLPIDRTNMPKTIAHPISLLSTNCDTHHSQGAQMRGTLLWKLLDALVASRSCQHRPSIEIVGVPTVCSTCARTLAKRSRIFATQQHLADPKRLQ